MAVFAEFSILCCYIKSFFRGHPLSTYANFSEKLTFLTPQIRTSTCAYQGVPSWHSDVVTTLSQRPLLTLSQRGATVENESCTDVSFRRCDNVALQRCQDVASTLLQRRHNIKHWICTRPFYYGLF